MKWLRSVSILLLTLAAASGADLAGVKSVYLMPMSSGLDQYLAVNLSTFIQVVTDPSKADAIFTDRIGASFEQSVLDLSPKPKKEVAQKIGDEDFSKPTMQPLSRGKGSIFLVDLHTHTVLWSMYAGVAGSEASKMNQLAGKIAVQFRKAWAGK